MAAESGSWRLIVALLLAGASTSSVGKASDNIFDTALARAAAHSRPEVAHLLLQAGAHENALDQVGRDALCVAGTEVWPRRRSRRKSSGAGWWPWRTCSTAARRFVRCRGGGPVLPLPPPPLPLWKTAGRGLAFPREYSRG
ncbi:unnamed protein product [Ectocarpus sp. 4 AP-2014]